MAVDIDLTVKGLEVTPTYSHETLDVSLEGVEESDILQSLTVQDAVDYFEVKDFVETIGTYELLDAIGEDECKQYFNLENKSDEETE